MTPEPPAEVPDFLVERVDELDLEALKATAEFARSDSYTAPAIVPDDVVESFALQDDETLEAIATYAEELGEYRVTDSESTPEEGSADSDSDDEGGWGKNRIKDWHGF